MGGAVDDQIQDRLSVDLDGQASALFDGLVRPRVRAGPGRACAE